ncbi:MAG: hypothetical protein H6510_02080 [Acidobacteria bacterium]|nr:hypothetical protein [Acidobacteriota bacterium]MCB9396581.1 hypothetical protein [Acidobacteriota bacterium]
MVFLNLFLIGLPHYACGGYCVTMAYSSLYLSPRPTHIYLVSPDHPAGKDFPLEREVALRELQLQFLEPDTEPGKMDHASWILLDNLTDAQKKKWVELARETGCLIFCASNRPEFDTAGWIGKPPHNHNTYFSMGVLEQHGLRVAPLRGITPIHLVRKTDGVWACETMDHFDCFEPGSMP